MYGKAENQGLGRSQFDSARLGFYQLLRRKRMSPQFVDRHGEDLFAQACFEYSRRATEVVIGDPPAWIVTCAWNRTVSLLESRDYRPRLVSVESVAEPVDDRSGPEESLLDEDRSRRVQDAVKELPLYQRELLALSYFEGESIREAGRRLGWTASKAQRAHEAAQKRIFMTLGVESSDEVELIGLFAFLSVGADRATGHTLPAGLEAALDSIHRGVSGVGHEALTLVRRPFHGSGHAGRTLLRPAAAVTERTGETEGRGPLGRIADLGRRLASGGLGEAGTALAGEGGSRALEVCKGVAVCVLSGSALTTALIGGAAHAPRPQAHHLPAAVVVERPVPEKKPVVGASYVRSVTQKAVPPVTAAASNVTKPAERGPTGAKSAKVEEAASAAPSNSGGQKSEEAETEAQFQNFAATEEPGTGSTATKSTSVADSATSTESSSTGSTAKKAEEAAAAKQFHGLLE